MRNTEKGKAAGIIDWLAAGVRKEGSENPFNIYEAPTMPGRLLLADDPASRIHQLFVEHLLCARHLPRC